MKALISKRSIVIASVSVLIALVTIISVTAFNSAGPVTGVANVITRPIRAVATEIAHAFGNVFAAMYQYEELQRREGELLRQIAQLQYDAAEAGDIAEENDRLRSLLGFRERHGQHAHEPASVGNMTGDNFSHSFTINRGYMNSRIQVGMGVVTEDFVLVGQISYVGATESIVRSVLDTTFAAAVFVGGAAADDADGTATARGDFAQMRNGLLVLDHMDDDLPVLPGSMIVTSGAGGVFPPGLTIGEIVHVDLHASGIGRFATIRPMRDIETIQNVFVILGFEVEDPFLDIPAPINGYAIIPEVYDPDDYTES